MTDPSGYAYFEDGIYYMDEVQVIGYKDDSDWENDWNLGFDNTFFTDHFDNYFEDNKGYGGFFSPIVSKEKLNKTPKNQPNKNDKNKTILKVFNDHQPGDNIIERILGGISKKNPKFANGAATEAMRYLLNAEEGGFSLK